MYLYLFFGDHSLNLSLTDTLVDLTKSRMGAAKERILIDLRKAAQCGKAGDRQVPINDPYFTIEADEIGFANMGNWQLRGLAKCAWSCEPYGDKCCCDCKATCSIHAILSKTFTFAPEGYNPKNADWPIRLKNWVASQTQKTFHWNDTSNPGFFISAEFDDQYDASYKPAGCK